ncbi:MAG: twin-arginine translocase subunit TatC [candidate division Zixibacteria bacterium]|nr:twin-arginine translocase subunit TatC [candidate division Zixibacteria bacterium]
MEQDSNKEIYPENNSGESQQDKPKKGMSFLGHIEELRWRLIKSILSVAAMALIAFAFADQLYKILTIPLGDVQLHYTEVTGSFYAYLKISMFAGITGAIPIIFYQLWNFIAPGLFAREKKMIIPLVFFSTILFLIGGSFCFFVVLPFALTFLIGYGEDLMTPIITISSYISFAGLLLVAFGFAFELPILGYFFGKIGLVSSKALGKARPYAVVVFLVLASVLSPPDIFTQVLLAGPLYLLYEITILIVRYTGKKG